MGSAGEPAGVRRGWGCPSDVGLRTVAEDERQHADRTSEEPVYEAIGPGWNSGTLGSEDDADWAPQPAGLARVALSLAVGDLLASFRAVRFWLVAVAVPLATSLFALALLGVAAAPAEMQPEEARWFSHLLAAALMPASSALLAVHWGLLGRQRLSGLRQPGDLDPGPLAPFLSVAARGIVVAAIALIVLVLHAGITGVSAAGTAGASAGVVALEFAVFGAIGAGVSALLRRRLLAALVGWTVAGALVAGNAVAVWALMPAVRADEPVTVAINVVWGSDGTRDAYECSTELLGLAEVFHTERIVWLVAANPVVMFAMLASGGETGEEGLGWMPGALQEAADGTTVPCVNAEPRTKDTARMPLEVIGLGTQGVVAGAFLAGGQLAARRRGGSGD